MPFTNFSIDNFLVDSPSKLGYTFIMKIRSGFVSNSSSSSFIVAFPKKPATQDDVLKEMFPRDPMGTVPDPFSNGPGLSHTAIAEQVFSDIQGESNSVTRDDLLEEFVGRYCFLSGALYYAGAPYHASDETLTHQYIESNMAYEATCKEFTSLERDMILTHVGPPVPYASDNTTDWNTKKPHTKADVDAYNVYRKQVESFKKKNKKYLAAKKKADETQREFWDTQHMLSKKLAEVDLSEFLKDNEGKFITRFTYSDNDGTQSSLMEHSGIFNNLPHITISHH